MDHALVRIHLNDGKVKLVSTLGINIESLSITTDKGNFVLDKVNIILMPTNIAVDFSQQIPSLQKTILKQRINMKLQNRQQLGITQLELTANIIHFYEKALLIICGGRDYGQISVFVPMSSIKSYKLGDEKERGETYVQDLLQQAINQKASDIHLKPHKNHTEIQFRVDGILRTIHKVSNLQHLKIISKLKIMAGMDIAERRLAQDGSISFKFKNRDVDLRISTAPTIEGESMVLRILDPEAGLKTLSHIGFAKEDEMRIKQALHKRSGLILVTGPTGSGKSTTLYAAMDLIRSLNLNTISIEDPVEYRVDDIKQIEVNDVIGNSFSNILRHVLRHDPDIIIIGEIRDQETAKIALQSALTGHLVISTLHTQDAAHAISRLMEMGIETYLIRDTLKAVLAQRLVRKLCQICEGSRLCKACNNTGFKGRIILYEWLEINEDLQSLINPKLNLTKFKQQAIKAGMQDFSHHAKKLIAEKLTSPGEVFLVD